MSTAADQLVVDAHEVEADRDEAAREEGESRKRAPVYHVFEGGGAFSADAVRAMLIALGIPASEANDAIANADPLDAWTCIATRVPGATDRKAITAVIGTHEEPVEGFDAERRLLPHVAVLTRHWQPRTRTQTIDKPTAEEVEELERRLAGTVHEDWT